MLCPLIGPTSKQIGGEHFLSVQISKVEQNLLGTIRSNSVSPGKPFVGNALRVSSLESKYPVLANA